MSERTVRDIPGVGGVLETQLAGLGIVTCSDVLKKAPEIYTCFNQNQFEFLLKASLGISRCQHEVRDLTKRSISISKTFRAITRKDQFIYRFKDIANLLKDKLSEMDVVARTI